MDYGCVKHIPLFIMVVLVFPSSLSSFGPVRPVAAGHITSKALSWLDSARLKSFMDSSHAFYKVKHCYWPGLLFVVNFFLFFSVFGFNFFKLWVCNFCHFLYQTLQLIYSWIHAPIPPLHSICNVDWNSCLSACKYDCMASVNTLKESTHL